MAAGAAARGRVARGRCGMRGGRRTRPPSRAVGGRLQDRRRRAGDRRCRRDRLWLRGLARGSPIVRCVAVAMGRRGHRGRRRHRRSSAELRARHALRVLRGARRDARRDGPGTAVARVVRAAPQGRRRRRRSGAFRGRALAPRRPAEATARHRQSARIRCRGVASRERLSRDRLRAQRRRECAPRGVRGARRRLHPARACGGTRPDRRRAAGGAVRRRDRRTDDRRAARDSRGAVACLQPHRHHASHQHLGPARDGLRGHRRRIRVPARATQRASHRTHARAQGRRGRRRDGGARFTCFSPARRCPRCARC